jgi:hypothetical protein
MRSVCYRIGHLPALLVLLANAAVADEPPLHERIDALIDAAAVGPLAPPANDADFLRRAWLDLAGVIPPADAARAFLADAATDKRQKLIESLLASPQFIRHMTLTWDVMLMERRNDKAIKSPEWQAWLYQSFATGKPLDQLCREIVATDGTDDALRPAARFLLDRDCEPNLLTRDLGRVLFGMDLQCAQCHDHPLIDDYYQADYYGLYAFVMRTSLFTDAKAKKSLVGEKAEGEANYKSVFTGDAADNVLPRLPKGATVAFEPTFAKGQEYVSAPAKDVRGIPKHSRRVLLANLLPGSDEFRRNLANRLWAQMFGRGLVHPVDFHHAANPPSHPELLTMLAEELAKAKFDAKTLLRQIALTRAYQRSCDAPRATELNLPPAAELAAPVEARRGGLTARIEELKTALENAQAERKQVFDELTRQRVEVATLDMASRAAQEVATKAAGGQKAADDTAKKKQEQALAVGSAARQTAAASKTIPDDKDIAQAQATLEARAKALAAGAEAAVKQSVELAAKTKAAELAAHSAAQVLANAQAQLPIEQLADRERAVHATQRALADARFVLAALENQLATAKMIGDWQAKAADPVQAAPILDSLAERWTVAAQLAPLKPLSNEQFVFSLMQATGMLASQEAAAAAALDKSPPDALKNAPEAERARLRAELTERQAFDQLRGNVKAFENLYGTLPGADFQATVNQSLYFGNGNVLQSWLAPGNNRLTDRLAKLEDTAALSDELYLAILTRMPLPEEKDEVANYLKDRTADRPAAIAELVWAVISSNEFRFNH